MLTNALSHREREDENVASCLHQAITHRVKDTNWLQDSSGKGLIVCLLDNVSIHFN